MIIKVGIEMLMQSSYSKKWRIIISMFTERGKKSFFCLLFSLNIFSNRPKPYKYACEYLVWIFLFRECRKISLSNHCYIYSNKNSPCLLKINKFSGIIFKCDTYYLKCDRHFALYKLHKTLETVRNVFFPTYHLCSHA